MSPFDRANTTSYLNASVLYHFRVVASYFSKVADLTYPICIWHMHFGLPQSMNLYCKNTADKTQRSNSKKLNFAEISGISKLESLHYRLALIPLSYFSRFDTIPA